MSAGSSLLQAYREWEQLTQVEGEAIRNDQWKTVQSCQEAKERMQPAIVQLASQAQLESESAGQSRWRFALDEILHRLVALEAANARTLAEKREQIAHRRRALDQTRIHLQGLKHCYRFDPDRSWQAYG